ncbi:hypothetical protein STAS_09356 [Striga asiatica]|uniref:Uncharacterized protein n=1 Tax=Striga asiatica TaxID=4170 RepID=A0A5A7PKF0_STRAF|nr:hypothetical protein STAS_09356 [Striga asiatica]
MLSPPFAAMSFQPIASVGRTSPTTLTKPPSFSSVRQCPCIESSISPSPSPSFPSPTFRSSIAATWTACWNPVRNKHPQSQPSSPAQSRPPRLGSDSPSQQVPSLLLNAVAWIHHRPTWNKPPQRRPLGPLQRHRCDIYQPPGAGAAVFLEGLPRKRGIRLCRNSGEPSLRMLPPVFFPL